MNTAKQRLLPLTLLACFVQLVGWVVANFDIIQAASLSSNRMGNEYSGTQQCRKCHEKFYKLWLPSRHAKAMQPFTTALANAQLTPQTRAITIGNHKYLADLTSKVIRERGPDGEKAYPIVYALGGKNVFYFLTPFERGRLQTLPVAFDVNARKWFDTAKSGVRHFPGGEQDVPVYWKDPAYTFNTACYNCHVSQLNTNYDLNTDTYHTKWSEPGINCETCHGPSKEHIQVCEQAPKGVIPKDLKTIRGGRSFTVAQNNDACSTCHAKAVRLTGGFMPGSRFFDHFDLVTLESPDYYPDGRDLGENYTLTSWMLSPCAQSGELSCLHCHTSSGRYRQKDNPNQSCAPCHQKKVANPMAHTFHKENSPGNKCIACHMPMTTFARMNRSDHSMLPPTPQATLRFQSPNACTGCHSDKDAAWANVWVREWRNRDYQAPLLHRAELIDAARKRNWEKLDYMLAYIESEDSNPVYSAALIRLLRACPDPKVWPVISEAASSPSPLIRASAVESLGQLPSRQSAAILLTATNDNIRLVRIKAAAALAGYPQAIVKQENRSALNKATNEYLLALIAQPDQWTSHYNLGNFLSANRDFGSALRAYNVALKLEPQALLPMVNAAMVHAQIGNEADAERFLSQALEVSPNSAAANFNMGLLKAEQAQANEAESHLRVALKSDPKMHTAAYNLGVLLTKTEPVESIHMLSKAYELNPTPKYGYSLAFYLMHNKDYERAVPTLESMIDKWPIFADAYLLLADAYQKVGRKNEAFSILKSASSISGIPLGDLLRIKAKIRDLQNSQ